MSLMRAVRESGTGWSAFFSESARARAYEAAWHSRDRISGQTSLFGLMGLTLAFALGQGFWIARKAESSGATDQH